MHDQSDCRSTLCQSGKAPPHNQLICLVQRIQKSNVQPNSQTVECNDQTAEFYMAMAEMMEEEEGEANKQQVQAIQPDVMQFTVAQEQTYGKQDQMYNFQIKSIKMRSHI